MKGVGIMISTVMYSDRSKNASKNKCVDGDQGGWETVKKKELGRWEDFFLIENFRAKICSSGVR